VAKKSRKVLTKGVFLREIIVHKYIALDIVLDWIRNPRGNKKECQSMEITSALFFNG
jgi:hypothetical protein